MDQCDEILDTLLENHIIGIETVEEMKKITIREERARAIVDFVLISQMPTCCSVFWTVITKKYPNLARKSDCRCSPLLETSITITEEAASCLEKSLEIRTKGVYSL